VSANTTPIFVGTPRNSYITTGVNANTAFDGTGTVATVFTAGSNGSKVETVSLWNLGTNVATVVRFFVNNGSTNATAANNALVNEITWAVNTQSQVAASVPVVWQPNLYLPAGYKLNCTIGTAIAAGIMVNCQGGDF
jgi:hypothetical protein